MLFGGRIYHISETMLECDIISQDWLDKLVNCKLLKKRLNLKQQHLGLSVSDIR